MPPVMSAIAAVLNLDGRPVPRELVVKLTHAMAQNGPDRHDVWVGGGAIGMGCASFFTVPEQLDEPMPLISGTRVLVLDGRIDNRTELRRECADRGVAVAQSAGDGACVMAAYDAWGVDAPAHLIGEWAFVLWDHGEERLIAARDHMARRSLRWWSDGRTLIVSSQFPGILEHPDVRARPNEAVIAEWLAGTPATIDQTLWSGIRNVPGGRRLVSVRGGQPRLSRYWDPREETNESITSLDEAADAMRNAVKDAVSAHLRCIGTPEIELSGGWDSSTVAAVAHDIHAAGHAPDFQLSSVVFPNDPLCDESPYVEAMERHLGRTSLKRQHRLEPFEAMADAMRELRHPWQRDDWRAIPVSPTHRVTLTGDGGDETLGGMGPSGPAVLADAFLMRRASRVGVRQLLTRVVRPHVRPSLPRAIRVARSAPPGAWVDRDLIRRTKLVQRLVDAESKERYATLRRRAIFAWLDSWNLQQSDLNGELDRGRYVELRHPLHDLRLVRLALRVPARVMGSAHTNPRHLHRYAYASSLPGLITGRTWGAEFTSLRVRELQSLVDGLGRPERLCAAGMVDGVRCAELVERATLGASDHWPAALLYAVELWMTSESLQ